MFSHILIPTDGTKQSDKAIENGIALAKKLGAKVTAVNCSVPWSLSLIHISEPTRLQ